MKSAKSYPGLKHSADMQALIKSLLPLKINYFAYTRLDQDAKFTGMSSSENFFEHYLAKGYHNADIHLAKEKYGNYVIWDHLKRTGKSEIMHTEASQFGINHTFTIVESNNHSHDYFHFATDLMNESINQTYITQLASLEKFLLNFKDYLKANPDLFTHKYKLKTRKSASYETLHDHVFENLTMNAE